MLAVGTVRGCPRGRSQPAMLFPLPRAHPLQARGIQCHGGKPECVDHLLDRKSDHGTPIVDWLLETSPYAANLSPEQALGFREKERGFPDSEPLKNKVRRLRIGFANKGKVPWNLGKQHRPGVS